MTYAQWEYMKVECNLEVEDDPSQRTADRMKNIAFQVMVKERDVYLWYPDGGCKIISVKPFLLDNTILNIVNALGEAGWEAFHYENSDKENHIKWLLKRQILPPIDAGDA